MQSMTPVITHPFGKGKIRHELRTGGEVANRVDQIGTSFSANRVDLTSVKVSKLRLVVIRIVFGKAGLLG